MHSLGVGTVLYLEILRTLGYGLLIMTLFQIPMYVFILSSNNLQESSSFLAKFTLGNLGTGTPSDLISPIKFCSQNFWSCKTLSFWLSDRLSLTSEEVLASCFNENASPNIVEECERARGYIVFPGGGL